MPWEFPTKASELLSQLEARGVARDRLLLVFGIAAQQIPKGDPLIAIIGTPMRGVRGSQERIQHLSAWLIEPAMVNGLRMIIEKFSPHDALREIGQDVERLMLEWFALVDVSWCQVREDRPEIVTRRDETTPASCFRGKSVSLWGCGALGGIIAECLVRAGVSRLILRDDGVVAPGLLTRQPYSEQDIGYSKAGVLAARLKTIRPEGLEIRVSTRDLLDEPLALDDWTDGADVVIDASASRAVMDKLELRRRQTTRSTLVVSLVIGHNADRGLVVLSSAKHSGGIADVVRRAKLASCNLATTRGFANEFWPVDSRRAVFQPEPGCSESTFIGSAADAFGLAGTLLNLAAADVTASKPATAFGHIVVQPHVDVSSGESRWESFAWEPDRVFDDPHSRYQIRVAPGAWRDMVGWIERSQRIRGFHDETGGILFGERDDASRVIWVSEVLGPPPDSDASPHYFVCGTEGVAEANEEKKTRSRGSVQYVGMWHTHPGSLPVPSPTDLGGMARLLTLERPSSPRPLLLIIGTTTAGRLAQVGAYVFREGDLVSPRGQRLVQRPVSLRAVVQMPKPPRRDVGLALSGGGSRAIAFHLGCLRALSDRGTLRRVQVLSGVSGGAVIAAMYAYGREDFAAFEGRVIDLLLTGLVGRIALEFLSPTFLGSLPWMVASGVAATGASGLRLAAGLVERLLWPRTLGKRPWSQNLQPPIRRRFSRVVAFERALTGVLGDGALCDPRRNELDVVFGACELSTGTAFRFGSRESGGWRFGRLADNDVRIAHAVAASAAFPALIPAFDEVLHFVTRDGKDERHRVVLTDGGVYDNLGISCMEPGRPESLGYNTFSPDYIVSCDAGHGQFSGDSYPYWWPSRMYRSFDTVFRKHHDAALTRLHDHASQGRLRGFVLPYLGQIDKALPYEPPDLVRREEAFGYPTDFSPMRRDVIDRLALRGEQLTRLLISRYCPEL